MRFFWITLCIMGLAAGAFAQTSPYSRGHAYVDPSGVLRWSDTEEEVQGFGVNYSLPFAHAYRQAKHMGVDVKELMRQEVYHFSRLGFDLYRLHVWDTEISDTLGNLLENEHLDAFDYLISLLGSHDINYVITPIAFWGNGWPEPDEATPGFSARYGKGDCLTDPACISAQQNYLAQFLNHVNPYTHKAYKDDLRVIAFEVSNEPHHRGDPAEVTAFVKGMVDAMRSTGTVKPIFYNTSHGVQFADAYFDGGIDGGTFQWYPTGLGYGQEIPGNVLPNVDRYEIPFDSVFRARGGAKLVYEFDAADVGRNYPYPAMARSFRSAGIQIATHFAYDPTHLAYANTEYNTHYMNLAYTPQKALSLMIAGRVFHEVPMYADFGTYPANTTFGNTRVSYKEDLAEYRTAQEFLYTNHTDSEPVATDSLEKIAGYGNSPVVQYSGSGAYFLDRLKEGMWRLEVMPDAHWVANPFGRNSPDRQVGAIAWREHTMTIQLPDLGEKFKVEEFAWDPTYEVKAAEGTFRIKPGVYILKARGVRWRNRPELPFEKANLGTYFAPEDNVDRVWVQHEPVPEATAGTPLTLRVRAIAPTPLAGLEAWVYAGWRPMQLPLEYLGDYTYAATVPAEALTTGTLDYYIVARQDSSQSVTYPGAEEGLPTDWDFPWNPYSVRIVPSEYPIYLFEAAEDVDELARVWRRGLSTVPTQNNGEMAYQINLESLFVPDNENLNAAPRYDYTFKQYVLEDIAGRTTDLQKKTHLVVEGQSLTIPNYPIQVAVVLEDGSSYGGILQMDTISREYRVSIQELKPVATVTLPRPYPSFLPYTLEHSIENAFDITRMEAIQISIGPGLSEAQQKEKVGVSLVRMYLE